MSNADKDTDATRDNTTAEASARTFPPISEDPLGVLRARLMSNPTYAVPPPVVSLRRIRKITTYEVLEADLDDLEKASRSENHSLAFTSLCVGGFISTVASWIGASPDRPIVFASYLAGSLILLIFSLHFGITWLRERARRSQLLDRIRAQTILIEETKLGV